MVLMSRVQAVVITVLVLFCIYIFDYFVVTFSSGIKMMCNLEKFQFIKF